MHGLLSDLWVGSRIGYQIIRIYIFFFTNHIYKLFNTVCTPFNRVHNRGFWGDGLLNEFNRLPHHTPGPSGIASLDPQTAHQYLKHYVSRRLCAPRSNSPLPMADESQFPPYIPHTFVWGKAMEGR